MRVGKGGPKEALVWSQGQIPSLCYKGYTCTLNTSSCSPTCTNYFYSTGDSLQFDSGKKSWARNRDFCMCWKLKEVSEYFPESHGVQQRLKCTGRLSLRLSTRLTLPGFCPLIFIVSCQLGCELWSRLSCFYMVQIPNSCDTESLLSLKLISFCLQQSALGELRQISSLEQGPVCFHSDVYCGEFRTFRKLKNKC